ncbi:MAG: hypothetical protein WDN06_18140 [Asticcacaulis sp.]
MLPGPDEGDYARRGQMPVFVPNYYRGAWRQHPEAAGRSSHLFQHGNGVVAVSQRHRRPVRRQGLPRRPAHCAAIATRLAGSEDRPAFPGRYLRHKYPPRPFVIAGLRGSDG